MPSFAILAQGDGKNPLIKIDAIPCKTVLFTEPDSTVQCEIQLWKVMRTLLSDCRPQPDFFLWQQIANPTVVLPSQLDQTRWIVYDFRIPTPNRNVRDNNARYLLQVAGFQFCLANQ